MTEAYRTSGRTALEETEADNGAGNQRQGNGDVRAALVSNGQTAKLAQPCQCALHNPTVPPQPLARVHPPASNTGSDSPSPQIRPTAGKVVRLVGMDLLGPSAWSPRSLSAHRRNGAEEHLEDPAVVTFAGVMSAASGIPLRSTTRCRFVPGRPRSVGFGPVISPPRFAGMLALSRQARLESICPASCKRLRSVWCRRSQTSATCQSRSRLQHVIPLPHPSSCGSICQGIPERSTKRIPPRTCRAGTRGLPPFGFDGSGGRSGSMISHSASGTSGAAMAAGTQKRRFRYAL
jgi:hypothetical protein